MGELVGYFIMWAIVGAILGAIFDSDDLRIGAFKGLAIAVFPIYVIFLIILMMVLFPLSSLFGRQKEYDVLIKKISIF